MLRLLATHWVNVLDLEPIDTLPEGVKEARDVKLGDLLGDVEAKAGRHAS